MKSSYVDYDLVTPGKSDDDAYANAKLSISIARKMGATIWLVPEDICQVRSRLVTTFIGEQAHNNHFDTTNLLQALSWQRRRKCERSIQEVPFPSRNILVIRIHSTNLAVSILNGVLACQHSLRKHSQAHSASLVTPLSKSFSPYLETPFLMTIDIFCSSFCPSS